MDPLTGQPFPDNRIPASRLAPGAVSLLRFLPAPNLPGAVRNFHAARTSPSAGDAVNLRITHNFSSEAGGFGGRGGRGGRFGPGGRGPGGRRGTGVVLNAQVRYRRNDQARLGAFSTVDGDPFRLFLHGPRRGERVPGRHDAQRAGQPLADPLGHRQPVCRGRGRGGPGRHRRRGDRPLRVGCARPAVLQLCEPPRRDPEPADRPAAAHRVRRRLRPRGRHQLRFGGEFTQDWSNSRTDASARGSFIFTGLYTGAGDRVPPGSGLDFADFLLGLPQQASVQHGPGVVRLRGRSYGLFVQDNWRAGAGLTLNAGVRYEVFEPFTEANGRMVGLDVTPAFTAAAPVAGGAAGAFTGLFPAALVHTDTNNVAPRVGIAWRANRATVVRTGYGVSFNSGSYASIARQLTAQPPFAVTNTAIGAQATPLSLSDPLDTTPPATTTNNYGIDKDYQLGVADTWNVDVDRTLARGWTLGGGYTGTRGSHLDILRAPNRDPDGLRIDGVQPFLWQSSGGASTLHAATLRLRKRFSGGVGGSLSYTLARSIDNASSVGGGAVVVAQDDRNLDAERGLSSFDRRHQVSADILVEFPFGADRRWLHGGGFLAALLERLVAEPPAITAESGTPYTARIVGSATEVARGTSGTLRARRHGGAGGARQPHPSAVLQHRRLRGAGPRGVRHRRAQHHHRSGRPAGRCPVDPCRADRRNAGRERQRRREQPAQRRAVRSHRHRRHVADLRAGGGGAAHAIRAARREVHLLMSCRMLPLLLAGAGVLSASLAVSAQPRGDTPRPLRAGVELVVVDVIVRDANGDVVRGLTANDFEVLEDGQPQTIVSFDFEEVVAAGSPAVVAPVLGAGLQPPPGVRADRDGRPREAPETRAGAPEPRRLQDLAGRRLIVLLFDVSSMQPEDADEAIRSALVYVDERMTAADLVAVATVGSTLEVQSDFTADRERLRDALSALVATGELAVAEAEVETVETDEQQVEAESGGVGTASEYDLFNNDVRLRAIRTVAENLQFIEQKKAIVYFSAGMRRSGGDNQVELRAAVNAAVRANAALYTVDARGLQAVVPGGDASRRSGRGRSLFSGQAMARQLDQLYSSQETLSTLADDTGGQAFTDTNDFGAVFAQVERDLSAYYLLGYQSPSQDAGRPLPQNLRAGKASRTCAWSTGRATTPTGTSPTRAGATANTSCAINCRRRCRPPTCRCWCPRAGSAGATTGTTSRCRSSSPVQPSR